MKLGTLTALVFALLVSLAPSAFATFPTNGDNGGNCKVPEPATLVLLGAGVAGVAVSRLRKEKE